MDAKLYTPPDTAPDAVLLPAPSLRETVYAQLRAAVLDGEFGARERLAEVRLAARFGVSRTPVREALARLASDGLIERGTAASSSPSPTSRG
ncbi:winged helix-turn-helix domain-containing protein [Kitasatospora viridis]|uniref:Regulatory GntR family protein n=1 Tax=Kitasatospora viridis TaxID=281105 RepID=A0A561TVS4_9ACTN|nr:winged helix-turn-helix domain-containing protein [Kitasatospora viridis]TWF91213.1 regulatory GntR family protein [Kitasatospora viridis]